MRQLQRLHEGRFMLVSRFDHGKGVGVMCNRGQEAASNGGDFVR